MFPLLAALSVASASTAHADPSRPRVAIIDSGIARTPELASLIVAEYDVAATPQRPAFRPRFDHGTMVATILARAARHNVSIISFRIDDPAGCPSGASPPCQPSAVPIADAIRRATALGVDAINLSLALDGDPRITAAVKDAAAKGIGIVMAAGNQGRQHPSNLAPARAAYPAAVLVGAVDAAGKRWSGTNLPDPRPRDYNYVWRLGVQVPTTGADGRPVTGTGTSFAVPIETARLLRRRARG